MLLFAQTGGIDGFLGTRGSLMLDVVFLAMFAVLPLLAVSIALVKRGKFHLHKKLQLVLGLVLLLAVVAFEVDMRLNGWIPRAYADGANPYVALAEPPASGERLKLDWSCPVGLSLIVHLFFAVPTAAIWVYTIAAALRKFPHEPVPGPYSAAHKFWGWLATIEMVLTAVTGWVFYYLAFIA
jgi:hypothetical protein